jgi:hypothetical protein
MIRRLRPGYSGCDALFKFGWRLSAQGSHSLVIDYACELSPASCQHILGQPDGVSEGPKLLEAQTLYFA